ncbi:FTCD-like protein [Mya arenaria]|uniref:Formimidoyltransferase-cyclodeaminase n=1 Tax=Mya arenaria TaxID=6604 RepID=A0ABY7DB46_MYAAR|nr:FTCD-like protein [Mya arenaria]
MPRIVECVPNFSVGRNKEIIEAIASAIAATEGVSLLDVDPGASTNRTVYTFVGSPDSVVEGALNGARVAYQAIDMRAHQECVECAKEFGDKLSIELGVPVYLYGEAATEPHRKTLPQIRAGEFEGIPEKIQKPEWKPDFGPAEFVPSWGATATGARKFLIAYNINILGTKEQAHRIALNIREQGRGQEQPGKLKHVQAIGWYLEEANMAQVSVNITDFEETAIHTVYDEELNLAVVGSQIVGLVPLQAIMDSAQFYMDKSNLFILEEDQKLRLVINRMGLNSLGAFSPKERIIEYMISDDREGPLVTMDVKDFILTVGSRSPSPGGGSVSALAAALGAALGSMVGFLTYGNRKFEHLDGQMRKLIPSLYKAMKDLTPFIDADAAAFSEYMLAMKLPAEGEEEQQMKTAALQQGLCTAIQVPLTVARISNSLWGPLTELAMVGNINCKSDLQVGARMLETAVWGAYYNVKTNLDDVKDEDFKKKVSEEVDGAIKHAQESCGAILKILEDRKA